jgi:hypothetical protein
MDNRGPALLYGGGNGHRPRGDAGIAIGPILFVIAILGLLAAAIAAGSGSFSSSTTSQASATKATALIEIGQNTKVGVDRLMANQVDLTTMIIDPLKTTSAWHLYSPTGGGVAAPSATMALNGGTVASDAWNYPLVYIPGVGTSLGVRMMVLPVAQGVCDQVNLKANGQSTPAVAALGDFGANGTALNDFATWPFTGKSVGCVMNSTPATAGAATDTTDDGTLGHGGVGVGIAETGTQYYFFQVIGIQ